MAKQSEKDQPVQQETTDDNEFDGEVYVNSDVNERDLRPGSLVHLNGWQYVSTAGGDRVTLVRTDGHGMSGVETTDHAGPDDGAKQSPVPPTPEPPRDTP